MKYCIKCGTEILPIQTKCDKCNGFKDMSFFFAGRGENIGEFFVHNWYIHTVLSGIEYNISDPSPGKTWEEIIG